MPVELDDAWIERVKNELPELPAQRQQRLMTDNGLTAYDAGLIVATKAMADYFDAACKNAGDDKGVANWLLGDVSAYLNNEASRSKPSPSSPRTWAKWLGWSKQACCPANWRKKFLPKAQRR